MTIKNGELTFSPSPAAWAAMQSAAYWRADMAYLQERYGVDGGEAVHELTEARRSLGDMLAAMEAAGVPNWAGNSALQFGRDWRRFKRGSLRAYLAKVYTVTEEGAGA